MQPVPKCYRPWTEADRTRLEGLVARHTVCDGKVCWSAVARDFPDRTAKQLKSYYWNVVRAEQAGSGQRKENAAKSEKPAKPVLQVQEEHFEPITDLTTDQEITMLFQYLTSGRDEYVVQKDYPQYTPLQVLRLMTKWKRRLQHMMVKTPFILLYPERKEQADFDLEALSFVSMEMARVAAADDPLAAKVRETMIQYYKNPGNKDRFYQFENFNEESLRAMKAKIDQILAGEGYAKQQKQ